MCGVWLQRPNTQLRCDKMLTNVVVLRNSLPKKAMQARANPLDFQTTFFKPLNNKGRLIRSAYVGRAETLTLLDIRNAHARADWVRKYFSGHFCEDNRSAEEQARYAYWHYHALHAAQQFLWGAHGR